MTQEMSVTSNETFADENENNLSQYIEGFADELSKIDLADLNTEFDSIKKEHDEGKITELEYTEKMFEFDDKLRDAKIHIPYKSLAAYVYSVKTKKIYKYLHTSL